MSPAGNKPWNRLLISEGGKRYVANISWLMAGRLCCMAVALAVGVYVARYLGPERFGLLSYVVSFVALFSIATTLGLDSVIVRELVSNPDERNRLLGTAFVLRIVGSFVVLVILAVTVFFTGNDGFTRLLIFIIAAGLLFQSFGVIQFYFEAKVLSKYHAFSQLAALSIISAAKLVFIFMGLPLIYFASATVAESILLSAGLIMVYARQKLSVLAWRFSFTLAKGLLRDSWPLILSGAAVSVYMRIDQVMIKQMLNTNEAVGQYAAAVKLSEVWYFIPMILCNSLFPAIINARNKDSQLYHGRMQKLYGLMLWTALPISLFVTLLASDIIHFLYGPAYSQAGPVLAIYIWQGPFVFLGAASGKFLIAENYTGISFARTFVGMVVNVIANIILIPRYGINGAALATVLSYFVAVFGIVFVRKTRSQVVLMIKSVNPLNIFAK